MNLTCPPGMEAWSCLHRRNPFARSPPASNTIPPPASSHIPTAGEIKPRKERLSPPCTALWMVSDKAGLPGTQSSIRPGSREAGPGPLAQPKSPWELNPPRQTVDSGEWLSPEQGVRASISGLAEAGPGPRRQPAHTSLGSPMSSLGAPHPVHSGLT